jgi:hypothetical protein
MAVWSNWSFTEISTRYVPAGHDEVGVNVKSRYRVPSAVRSVPVIRVFAASEPPSSTTYQFAVNLVFAGALLIFTTAWITSLVPNTFDGFFGAPKPGQNPSPGLLR